MAKNAEEVGLELRPNQVIVFGSPKVGTQLMQENPSISIELPLKISVWEDKNGSVWTTFPQMRVMGAEYGLDKKTGYRENAGAVRKDSYSIGKCILSKNRNTKTLYKKTERVCQNKD